MTPKEEQLKKLYEPYLQCALCPLAKLGRNSVVFGEGNANAEILFIGEGPGKEEDLSGRPFVGRSGKLLDRALKSADIDRSDVYITNIVKCRPPQNRKPSLIESSTCTNLLLKKQIAIIQPKIICTLGAAALEGFISKETLISRARGTLIKTEIGIIMPTYHPAYILRNPKKLELLIADLEFAKKQISTIQTD